MNEKQKTAVQLLKCKIQEAIEDISDEQMNPYQRGYKECLNDLLEDIDKALEMEREQIIKTHQRGMDDSFVNPDTDSEEYFNNTYQTEL